MKKKIAIVLIGLLILMNIPVFAENISISSISVSGVTQSGYTVTVQVANGERPAKVLMPTWTESGGQDDLVWHEAVINGNQAVCQIAASSHNNEAGRYITHVYVYRADNTYALEGVYTELPSKTNGPVIEDIAVSNLTADGYQVTATISSQNGIARVDMPSWTQVNGQDDLIWHRAEIKNNTAVFYVPASAHKGETGTYITHIYVYDNYGVMALRGINVTVPAKENNNVTTVEKFTMEDPVVSEVTEEGYRVTVSVSAPAGIAKVDMPSWTDVNGQDDLVWHQAAVNGNTATCYIPISDHKKESGKYITHVYVYDKTGKNLIKGIEITVPAKAVSQNLEITSASISELTENGYRVTAKIPSGIEIARAEMPSWTEAGGQDDLVWHQASIQSDTVTAYISAAEHKQESGKYITHIYVYDKNGKKALKGIEATVPNAQKTPSTETGTIAINNVAITELTQSGFRVTAAVAASAGIEKVEFAVWTDANGQDDLKWHTASVSGDQATAYISVSEHKNEAGTYQIHVYLYAKDGQKAIKGSSAVISGSGDMNYGEGEKLSLSIPFVTRLTSEGYQLQVRFAAPSGVRRISAAVWTVANGQDDLKWHEMTINGGIATVWIPISEHNYEHGAYTTNVYIWDYAGKQLMSACAVPVP